MAMTDPIADMLTRIRNANVVYHDKVDIPSSKMKVALADILKNEGYIRDYQQISDNKQGVLRVFMKYGAERERVITGLKRISKPGLRVYVKKTEVPRVLNGLGVAVISTTAGLLSDRQARAAGLGGEVVCYIW
ncbi:MAG: 30S ribosomal protein S8 [Firmicutes bacterium]|jgi:small subunit ribosomal protein S8|nr:30S ribosomal protein S8 [Bacillota bacterium]